MFVLWRHSRLDWSQLTNTSGFGIGFFNPGFFKVSIKIKITGFCKVNVAIALMAARTLLDVVLDGAKVMFSRTNHCADKCNDANAICAISAMCFGDPIEILEFLAIKDDEVLAGNFGDAVYRETCPLVKRHKGIQKQQWKDHAVDDGAGDQIDGPGAFDQCKEPQLVIGFGHGHSILNAPGLQANCNRSAKHDLDQYCLQLPGCVIQITRPLNCHKKTQCHDHLMPPRRSAQNLF